MRYLSQLIFSIILLSLIAACTTINSRQTAPVYPGSSWGIATFNNNTEIPQAGHRATSITTNLLQTKGVNQIALYTPSEDCNQFIVCPNTSLSLKKIFAWARENQIRYVMTGSVNEWQYKVGVDGEPVAAVSMQLYDVDTGQIVYSAVGSKTGGSRSGLSNTAQSLIRNMLNPLRI